MGGYLHVDPKPIQCLAPSNSIQVRLDGPVTWGILSRYCRLPMLSCWWGGGRTSQKPFLTCHLRGLQSNLPTEKQGDVHLFYIPSSLFPCIMRRGVIYGQFYCSIKKLATIDIPTSVAYIRRRMMSLVSSTKMPNGSRNIFKVENATLCSLRMSIHLLGD